MWAILRKPVFGMDLPKTVFPFLIVQNHLQSLVDDEWFFTLQPLSHTQKNLLAYSYTSAAFMAVVYPNYLISSHQSNPLKLGLAMPQIQSRIIHNALIIPLWSRKTPPVKFLLSLRYWTDSCDVDFLLTINLTSLSKLNSYYPLYRFNIQLFFPFYMAL